jgi:hypothetical protein
MSGRVRIPIILALILVAVPAMALRQHADDWMGASNDLQWGCFIYAANGPEIDRVVSYVQAHRHDYPRTIAPFLELQVDRVAVSRDLFEFLRRVRWCAPTNPAEMKLTVGEAIAYREALEIVLEVAKISEGK